MATLTNLPRHAATLGNIAVHNASVSNQARKGILGDATMEKLKDYTVDQLKDFTFESIFTPIINQQKS